MASPLRAIPVQSLAAASVVVGYTAIGALIPHSLRMLWVQNLTDQTIMLSFDAINDHFPLASNAYILLDVNANQLANSAGFFIENRTTMYAKRIGTPTTGSVYVSGFYALGE